MRWRLWIIESTNAACLLQWPGARISELVFMHVYGSIKDEDAQPVILSEKRPAVMMTPITC